ncbi:MAG: hypothetical protein R3F35_21690 [Myxococcota bacterium]
MIPIEGVDPRLGVSPADDDFHRPTSADPSWIETVWFPFWIPEAGISVYARIWFRPNAGEQGGAVHAWHGTSEILAYDGWTEPFTGFGDLRDLSLARGFRLVCESPLSRYRITHRSASIELDVAFEARTTPNPVAPEESPGMFAGHLEQPGRVRGRIRLGERSWAIDCGSIRDRSWGPRTMRSDLRLGNAHGTSRTGDAFFAYVNPDAAGIERITSGYFLQAGRAARIVAGERRTHWEGAHPRTIELELRDALDRTARYRGDVANRQAIDAGQEIYAVLNLVRWTRAGAGMAASAAGFERAAPPAAAAGSAAGDPLWGENHDIWSRSAWLATGRAPLPKRG